MLTELKSLLVISHWVDAPHSKININNEWVIEYEYLLSRSPDSNWSPHSVLPKLSKTPLRRQQFDDQDQELDEICHEFGWDGDNRIVLKQDGVVDWQQKQPKDSVKMAVAIIRQAYGTLLLLMDAIHKYNHAGQKLTMLETYSLFLRPNASVWGPHPKNSKTGAQATTFETVSFNCRTELTKLSRLLYSVQGDSKRRDITTPAEGLDSLHKKVRMLADHSEFLSTYYFKPNEMIKSIDLKILFALTVEIPPGARLEHPIPQILSDRESVGNELFSRTEELTRFLAEDMELRGQP